MAHVFLEHLVLLLLLMLLDNRNPDKEDENCGTETSDAGSADRFMFESDDFEDERRREIDFVSFFHVFAIETKSNRSGEKD